MRFDPVLTAADAATSFAHAYYVALDNARESLKSYYSAPESNVDGTSVPRIVYNGTSLASADALQDLFVQRMPPTFHEVQTVDAHVLNPRHFAELSSERNMSITVVVGGYLRLDDAKTGPLHEFSETFVLVPNRARLMGKGADVRKREWLVASQVCRWVVSHDPIETAGWTSMDVDDS